MKKKLVFDMDGTLLDSMGMWKNIFNDIKNKKIVINDLEPLSSNEGSMLDYCYNLIKENYIHYEKEKIYRLMHNHLVEFYSNNKLCKKNVYETLEKLYNDGYEIYVATATDYYYAKLALTSNNLDKFLLKIYTGDNVKFPKENYKYFEHLVNDLDTNPNNIVFFDDALYANKFGNKIGMKTVGVFDIHSSLNDEVKKEADYFIDDFNQINEYVL